MESKFRTEQIPCVSVHVDKHSQLDAITERFTTFTTGAGGEVILDCIYLQTDEDLDTIREILELSASAEIPTEGLIHFWK